MLVVDIKQSAFLFLKTSEETKKASKENKRRKQAKKKISR